LTVLASVEPPEVPFAVLGSGMKPGLKLSVPKFEVPAGAAAGAAGAAAGAVGAAAAVGGAAGSAAGAASLLPQPHAESTPINRNVVFFMFHPGQE